MTKVHIHCGTWNVNAKGPSDLKSSLSNWLCKGTKAPDIIAVSLQEIVGLSDVTQYIQSKRTEEAAEAWAKAFVETLEAYKAYGDERYSLVANAHMVGTMTCVLAKRSHLSAHQNEVAKRNSDFAMILDGMTFHKVDSSLSGPYLSRAAEPLEAIVGVRSLEKTESSSSSSSVSEGRSSGDSGGSSAASSFSSKNLLKRMSKLQPLGSAVSLPRRRTLKKERRADYSHKDVLVAASFGKEMGLLKINNHDIVFWFGDLNYRVDGTTWQKALQQIKRNDLEVLLEHDQLCAERNGGRCFQDFFEGELHFKPTYKFRPGTNKYDQREAGDEAKKKVRVPAWCDRILWKTNSQGCAASSVQQCSYYSCPGFVISDHKPVGAEFVLPFLELHNHEVRASERRLSIGNRISKSAHRLVESNSTLSIFSSASMPPLSSAEGPRSKDLASGSTRHCSGSSEASDAARLFSSCCPTDVAKDAQIIDDALEAMGSSNADANRSQAEEGQPASPGNRHAASAVMQSVCATRDFHGDHADELSFCIGDLIVIHKQGKIEINDGYLLGELMSGKVGYFRSEDVHPMGVVKRTVTKEDQRKILKATAMRFDRLKCQRETGIDVDKSRRYHDQQPQQQKFIIKVLLRITRLAAKNAKAIRRERSRSEEYLLQAPGFESMLATQDYKAPSTDELSLKRGDRLTVLSSCPSADDQVLGWIMCKTSDGQQGLVRRDMLEPCVA